MNLRVSVSWVVVLAVVVASSASFSSAADKVDPTGTWTWVRELEGQESQSVLSLSYKNGILTGSYKRQGQVVPISNAKLGRNEISFEADGKWNDQKVHGKFKGKLSADEINGSIEIVVEDGALPLAWVARRGVDADDVAGTWKLKVATPNGPPAEAELSLSLDGGGLKGKYHSPRFGQHGANDIRLKGRELSWEVDQAINGQSVKAVYKGTIEGHTIRGSLALDSGGTTSTLGFTGEEICVKPVRSILPENAKQSSRAQQSKAAVARPNG